MNKIGVEVAAALEDAFFEAMPDPMKNKRAREADWVAALSVFQEKARAIRARYKLGLFGRARAAYHLQQRLFKLGYPAEVVNKVVFMLVLNAFTGKS